MTDWLLAAVPHYGLWILSATTFLSCLALPVPSSMMMLAAGGFSASGDLSLPQTLAAAYLGAVAGDQAGYALGRAGGAALLDRLARAPQRAHLIGRATDLLHRHGALAIFLTRWLFSPVGPWANLTSGAARLGWGRFTLWGAAGEAVWVGLYTVMGRLFADNLEAASDLLSSGLGLIAGLAAVAGLGLWLRAALRERGHGKA